VKPLKELHLGVAIGDPGRFFGAFIELGANGRAAELACTVRSDHVKGGTLA
jgi:hypothetical protein